MTDRIYIICSSDNNYAQHLGIMLCSLFENNKNNSFAVYVIDGGIDNENLLKLEELQSKYDFVIDFLRPDKALYEKAPIKGYLNKAAYYRLQISDLLPKSVSKILYLDCDLIVNGDVLPLWKSDLQGKTIGAIDDPTIAPHMLVKLISSTKWFNSGVLLIDMDLWRKNNIKDKCFQFIRENADKIVFADQDVLNVILENNWHELSPKFNCMPHCFNNGHGREIVEAKKHPTIIHFCSVKKPWMFECEHELKLEYWKYLKKTPWKDYRTIKPPFYRKAAKPYHKSFKLFKKHYVEKYVPELIREQYEHLKSLIVDESVSNNDPTKDKISIISSIDDNYAQHYGVMLVSLLENKKKSTIIDIYLMHGHLSDTNRSKIESIAKKYDSDISFIAIDRNHYRNCIVNGHITDTTYYRLSIANLVPKELDKILYLDCDMVITDSLESLWNIDIRDYFIGAVANNTARDNVINELRQNIVNLGITDIFKYFNAGVMLINLEKWRRADIESKAFEYIRTCNHELKHHEQDVLNALLHDKYLQIPEKFNYLILNNHEKIRETPCIIHYAGPKKPWEFFFNGRFQMNYYRYLWISPWKFFIPQDLAYINLKYRFLQKHPTIFKGLRTIKAYLRFGTRPKQGNI